ncbi:hypothetical protein TSOC_014249 [Tetrabaena socialis]|uniref:Uncharacterized protein n=1 Tax=Tetrabaena socialis TaxID=47790 RepID=A0A2J7ZI46_9CHLO|nr:hypothetical protein TSOC_014249 [Tetrabaena socialis]|eukprot:PNG99951.1 hypothetical protein TSOC_014249 [Tetrabaena socialis]
MDDIKGKKAGAGGHQAPYCLSPAVMRWRIFEEVERPEEDGGNNAQCEEALAAAAALGAQMGGPVMHAYTLNMDQNRRMMQRQDAQEVKMDVLISAVQWGGGS